jgi:hypothetical protein
MRNNMKTNNMGDTQQLLTAIRHLIDQSRTQVQRSVNSAMVATYWQIGRLIVEHEQAGESRAAYGARQLQHLALHLTEQYGKGCDVSNLRNMRRFYQAFPIQDSVRPELSWTHYRKLMAVENPQARNWYVQETIEQNWSARALDPQISVLYYERLLSSQDQHAIKAEAENLTRPLQTSPKDYLRDPYVLDFLNLSDQHYLENNLEKGIIHNLQQFLLELGKGFAFVARQQRVSIGEEDFYIDLVFYNYKLKCFLLIDLKLGKLTHQDVGQMDTYIRVYDQHKKSADDNPTIGLILCSQKSEAVVKYSVLTDNQQLFTAKYVDYLPTEAELKRELEREREYVELQIEEAHAEYQCQ